MPDPLYPIALKLSGRPVCVIGAGAVAARKVRDLLACGAAVTVVAPEAVDEIRALAGEGRLRWEPRSFEPGDLDRAALVMAATDDRAVNVAAANAAHARGLLINVADVPDLCDFYLPAVERRGPVVVAVSSGGASPALAGQLVRELGRTLPDSLARHAELLAEARARLRERYPDDPARRHERGRALARAGTRQLVEQGRDDEARQRLQRIVDGPDEGDEGGGA